MKEIICPLCSDVIKGGQIRKDWWQSDFNNKVAHESCITAYEKGIVKGNMQISALTQENERLKAELSHYSVIALQEGAEKAADVIRIETAQRCTEIAQEMNLVIDSGPDEGTVLMFGSSIADAILAEFKL